MLKLTRPKKSIAAAENILKDSSDHSYDYITCAESSSCKYCGDKSVKYNGYCSRCCSEKDAVWNNM